MAWSLPVELDQPLSRQVAIVPMFRVLILVCVAPFLAVPVLILLGIFLVDHSMAYLKASGVKTVGVIKAASTSTSSRGGNHQVYLVGYVFVPQTETSLSRSYTGEAGLTAQAFHAMAVGDTVIVAHDPRSPGMSRLKSEMDTRWAHPYADLLTMTEILVPLAGILMALILGCFRVAYVRERRLVQWGSVAPAVIPPVSEELPPG